MSPSTSYLSTSSAAKRRWGLSVGLAVLAAALSVVVLGAPGAASSAGTLKQPHAAGQGAPAGMCAEVTPEAVGAHTTAFAGKVTQVKNGKVTIAVQDRYRSATQDRYVTTQGPKEQSVDGAPLRFKVGTTYLIAARKNQITTCGVSGPRTPDLQRIYDRAFAPLP